jgi:hypothetical protein
VDAVNLADPAWEAEVRRHGRIALAGVSGPAVLEIGVEGAPVAEARSVAASIAGALDGEAVLREALGGRGRVEPVAQPTSSPEASVAVRIAANRVPGAAAMSREIETAARRAGLRTVEDAPLKVVARIRPGRPTPDWPENHAGGSAFVPLRVDTVVAHSIRLHHAQRIGTLWDMDSARIAERWWYS